MHCRACFDKAIRLLRGDAIASAFIWLVAGLASITGYPYILFPELGALAHDVFLRPRGTWASAPGMLVVTPLLTAVLGTVVSQHFDYGVLSVITVVIGSVAVIRITESPIAPAISAALLPLSLGEESWDYPPSIIVGTTLLALATILYSYTRRSIGKTNEKSRDDAIDDVVETAPSTYGWVAWYAAFVMIAAWLSGITGWRFILFPPLAVIGFEMFAHHDVCPWSGKPVRLIVTCFLTACAGTTARGLLGVDPVAVLCAMIIGVVVVRLSKLHVPPAIAICLLPFIIKSIDYRFPLAVAVGTALLGGVFVAYQRLGSCRWYAP